MCLQDMKIAGRLQSKKIDQVALPLGSTTKIVIGNSARFMLSLSVRYDVGSITTNDVAHIYAGPPGGQVLVGVITPSQPNLRMKYTDWGELMRQDMSAITSGDNSTTLILGGTDVFLTATEDMLERELR